MLLPETQRLLKANAVRELGVRVAFNFEDLHHQGDAYLAQVREQAAELFRAAQQDAEKLREQTHREAKEAGRKDGLRDAAQLIEHEATRIADQRMAERIATTVPAIAAIAQAMQRELDGWLLRWEETAVHTAVAIAEKLLHRELKQRPELSKTMITEALRLAAGHPQLRIHLHPQDVQHLGDHASDLVRSITACAEAVVIPDPEVTRGGCRIETRHGEMDARVETMLARIAEELLA